MSELRSAARAAPERRFKARDGHDPAPRRLTDGPSLPASLKPTRDFSGSGRIESCLSALQCAGGLLWPLLLFSACAVAPGPGETLRRYARALEEGRLDEAFAMTASGTSKEAFAERYRTVSVRRARAEAVRADEPALVAKAQGRSVHLVLEDGAWRVREGSGESPRDVAFAFLAAAERGDFRVAYGLLAARWRARYTPELLEADFRAEPGARERLSRARHALEGTTAIALEFPIGDGRALRLVAEGTGYRVLSLE